MISLTLACTWSPPPGGGASSADGTTDDDDDDDDDASSAAAESSSDDEGGSTRGGTTADETVSASAGTSTQGTSTSGGTTSTSGGTTGTSGGTTGTSGGTVGTSTSTSGDDTGSTTVTEDSGPMPSTGCGAASPGSGRASIDVGGTSREYILTLPDNYDPNHAYPVVFGFHPLGGSADQVATGFGGGYYGLLSLAQGSAIFVSPEGLDAGWANTQGRDIAFVRAMLDRFRGELCIDEARLFSTGFSYGGMMSFAIGCEMGDVFRAIAPMAGALYSGCSDQGFPIAMMGWHGDVDSVVPLSDGEMGRDVILGNNQCEPTTAPVEPSPCVTYAGCDDGYPAVWCVFSGDHVPAPNSAQPIWDFFSQF